MSQEVRKGDFIVYSEGDINSVLQYQKFLLEGTILGQDTNLSI